MYTYIVHTQYIHRISGTCHLLIDKMAEETGDSGSDRLRLIIKTTKDKIEIDVPTDSTVKQVFAGVGEGACEAQ